MAVATLHPLLGLAVSFSSSILCFSPFFICEILSMQSSTCFHRADTHSEDPPCSEKVHFPTKRTATHRLKPYFKNVHTQRRSLPLHREGFPFPFKLLSQRSFHGR
eukprot:c8384_g1_i1 orf=2-313(-)